jgi:hypothetical protein
MAEDQTSLFPELKAKPKVTSASRNTASNSQYGEEAVEILKGAGSKGMHVDDIVAEIIRRNSVLKDPPEYIKTKVNAYLSSRAWKDGKPIAGSEIRKVMNPKTKTYKKGWYKFYKKPEPKEPRPHIQPDTSNTTLFGTGGEYAVASEFLYKGYNVSRPAVDDGIDLIVFKNGIFSNIQVKTASSNNGKFQFSIKTDVFSKRSDISTFYVLLCRRVMNTHYRNDYIVLPSTAIELFINQGYVNKGSANISLNVTVNASDEVMLNGKYDITTYLNRF